jgi:NADH-quinone oxidoreductase subunit L
VALDDGHDYASSEDEHASVVLAAVQAEETDGYSSEAKGCGFADPADGTVCYAPKLSHATFSWSKAMPSIILVFAGILFSAWVCMGIYGDRKNPLVGLTSKFAPARWVHTLLVNKYYLDHLYEKIIVFAFAHPIAKAAYWVNQNILDGIVDSVGRGGRATGEWVYRNVDQRVVDGAVNASGLAASEGGHALQPVQSGKVNQYGALLFGAATVGAIVLILVNI